MGERGSGGSWSPRHLVIGFFSFLSLFPEMGRALYSEGCVTSALAWRRVSFFFLTGGLDVRIRLVDLCAVERLQSKR